MLGIAHAQQVTSADPPKGVACAYNASPPTLITGNAGWLQCDSTGHLLTTSSGGGGGSVTQGTTPWVDNITQFGGSNVATGTGTGGAGIPRVTVSSDSSVSITGTLPAFAATPTVNIGTLPALAAGTAAIGKIAPGYTSAQTPASASSGVAANASAAATLTGASGKSTYISGFDITSDGATVGGCVNPTVTGLLGGTRTYTYCVPAGVTSQATPLIISFSPPLISSAVNTNVVVTLPALGAGSTTATVNAQGYVE